MGPAQEREETPAGAITGGVSYYPDHWPRDDWERDLSLIKESGLDIVRFGEFSWYWFEPERGRFDFAGYDQFMDAAERIGLRVLLCTPTAAPPQWLLSRYPHVRLVDQHGLRHAGGRHMICYNDPTARYYAERMIRRLVERYRNHPALFAWQIDNEPTVGESASDSRFYDYHPDTVRLFREALKDRYGSLETLNGRWVNTFWSNAYDSWESITPPHGVGGVPGLWLEWLRFRDRNTADLVAWQRDLIREIDSAHPVGTNIPETGPTRSALFGQDYWAQAEGLDYIGLDIYCYSGDAEAEEREIGFSCDLLGSAARSNGAAFWVSETQAGPHRRPWKMSFVGGVWGPDFLKRSTGAFVRHGAEKIIYFLWRPVPNGQEFGMNGMVHFDGSPSDISRSASLALDAAASVTPIRREKRRTAWIHYSRDSLLLGRGFDAEHTAESAHRGWHALLLDCGYSVEFVADSDLERGEVGDPDLLLLPYTIVMTKPLASAIARCAERGVPTVFGYATAFFDECASCFANAPGYGLSELCGVQFDAFDFARGEVRIADSSELALEGVMRTYLRECGSEVSGISRDSDGVPLVVAKGKMRTFLFDIGSLYHNEPSIERRSELRALFDGCLE